MPGPLLVSSWLTPAALVAAAFASPEVRVEAVPTDGPAVSGELLAIAGEGVSLSAPAGAPEEVRFAFDSLAELRFPAAAGSAARPDAAVTLRGGSTLPVAAVTLEDGELAATTPGLGSFTTPGRAVRAIRFRPLAGADLERWEELVGSNPDGDLVVVRRGERLDRLVGSVGGVGEETVTFLLNGSEIPLPRGRANFIGLIFRATPVDAKPRAVVKPHVGGELRAAQLSADASGALAVTLIDGPTLTLPAAGVAAVDFASGSATPLSELPTREPSETTLGWADDPWPVGRDRNLEGEPIRIAGRSFERGLVLHAPAELTWKLPKGTARLRATAGIEDARRSLGVGEVTLTISGDGRELFSGRLTHADEPVELDVDLTGVRTLAVAVGVGDDPFAGDHLALGNARITR